MVEVSCNTLRLYCHVVMLIYCCVRLGTLNNKAGKIQSLYLVASQWFAMSFSRIVNHLRIGLIFSEMEV